MSRLPQLMANAKSEGWDGWVRTSADEQAVLAGYTFDVNAAERVRVEMDARGTFRPALVDCGKDFGPGELFD